MSLQQRHFEALLKKGDDRIRALEIELERYSKQKNQYERIKQLEREISQYKTTIEQLRKKLENK